MRRSGSVLRRRGGRPRCRALRHRRVRRRLRVHARRRRARPDRRRDVLGIRSPCADRGPRRAPGHVEGEDGQLDQARGRADRALAEDRSRRRPRTTATGSSIRQHRRRHRRDAVKFIAATSTTHAREHEQLVRELAARSALRSRARAHRRGGGELPEHEAVPRGGTADPRCGRRGDAPRGPRAARSAIRAARTAPFSATRAADAEHLHRRPGVPLVLEWISVQDLATSAATVVELAKLWAEPEWSERGSARPAWPCAA